MTLAKKSNPVKKAAKSPAQKRKPAPATILFTGFPGFIGKRIVEILRDEKPAARFMFLVQDKYVSLAHAAIGQLAKGAPGFETRCEILLGDLTEPDLGLDDATRKRIAGQISEVWHLAAVYDLAVGEKTAYRVNVEGTGRMLELCGQVKKLDKLVYFSTCVVSGKRTGLVLEDEFEMGQGFNNHYESTKFEAESLVREKMDRIPTILIRPSVVIGDSTTGETDKFDGPYFLLRLLARATQAGATKAIRLPGAGQADVSFNMIPVDYLAKAACAIAADNKNLGCCFQISDPAPMTARELFDRSYDAFGLGRTWGMAPVWLVDQVAKVPVLGQKLGVPLQVLPYLSQYTVFDNQNTDRALSGTSIACPNIRSYFDTIVNYVKDRPEFSGKAKT